MLMCQHKFLFFLSSYMQEEVKEMWKERIREGKYPREEKLEIMKKRKESLYWHNCS